MTQRNWALDGARGFSVLFIPAVHCFLAFGEPYTHESMIAYSLRSIAEGPGAHVFMTMMGIVFTFRKQYDTEVILKRAATILTAGYVLNILKFIVPYIFGGLPDGVLIDLHVTPGKEIRELFFIADIFHFAAIALITIHFIYRINNYWCCAPVIAIITIIIGPYGFDLSNNYCIQLFTGAPPKAFFPVLSWICYPLMGLTIGYLLARRKQQTIKWMGIVGIMILIITVPIIILTGNISPAGYYRPYAIESVAHVSIVLITLSLWHLITPKIVDTRFFALLQFASKNITTLYMIQWIFICWLLPFTGYQTMNLLQTSVMAIYTTVMSVSLTYFINQLIIKYTSK
jgi:hypothetical protein